MIHSERMRSWALPAPKRISRYAGDVIAATLSLWILLLAALMAVVVQLWALVDCLMAKPADFERTFKRTKQFWLLITGLSVLAGLLYFFNLAPSFGLLLNVAGCVGAGVYLADVRPALREARRGGSRPMGPYGPW